MLNELTVWERIAFLCGLVVILIGLVWNVWLFWRARARRFDRTAASGTTESDFHWVFLVPAMNEEVTIADSVERLLAVRCTKRNIVVIDDGSSDRTPEILAAIEAPDLLVIRRDFPDAQQGKSEALNDAWARLPVLLRAADPMYTIVCIVDADGRLDPDAPEHVANWFADPEVGGVQVRVRIYNRSTVLTWAQDVEFGVYGRLYQAARATLGTAGMGGNGQFNRLATLDDLAGDGAVPWRNRLTEDQDIGLRMLQAGWRCGHENRASVHQQGLSNFRRLLRQRTRWSQGNLQAMQHLGSVHRVPRGPSARLDMYLYLLQPVFAGVVGVAMLAALSAFVFRGVAITPSSVLWVVVFFFLGFGGVILGCIARRGRGALAWVNGFAVGTVYAAYTWLLWPVLVRAIVRMVTARSTWAKTEREALEPPPAT